MNISIGDSIVTEECGEVTVKQFFKSTTTDTVVAELVDSEGMSYLYKLDELTVL